MTRDVRQMVATCLRQCSAAGLVNTGLDCICVLDDLAPCGELKTDCQAARQAPCDCGDHDFHLIPMEEL